MYIDYAIIIRVAIKNCKVFWHYPHYLFCTNHIYHFSKKNKYWLDPNFFYIRLHVSNICFMLYIGCIRCTIDYDTTGNMVGPGGCYRMLAVKSRGLWYYQAQYYYYVYWIWYDSMFVVRTGMFDLLFSDDPPPQCMVLLPPHVSWFAGVTVEGCTGGHARVVIGGAWGRVMEYAG